MRLLTARFVGPINEMGMSRCFISNVRMALSAGVDACVAEEVFDTNGGAATLNLVCTSICVCTCAYKRDQKLTFPAVKTLRCLITPEFSFPLEGRLLSRTFKPSDDPYGLADLLIKQREVKLLTRASNSSVCCSIDCILMEKIVFASLK